METLYKFLACSVYGVTGYPNFRLFDPDVSNSITYVGRECIYRFRKVLNKAGYEMIYADTDSVFVQLKTSSVREPYIVEHVLREELRKYARTFGAKRPPEIKFERLFRRVFFKVKVGEEVVAKKRYAGYTADGQLYIIGFEPRRSDSAEITRELMKKFFELVLVEDKLEEAISQVREAWENLPNMPIQKVAVPKSLRKEEYKVKNPWLVGVRYSSKHFGKVFREDRRPLMLYVKRTIGLPPTSSICLTEDDTEVPRGIEVDWNRMRERVIGNQFRGIFEALGIDFGIVTSGTRQTTLMRFS